MGNEHSELLKLLQTHGEQFLESFPLPNASTTSRKRKRNEHFPKVPIEDDGEEWGGIVQDNNSDSEGNDSHAIKEDLTSSTQKPAIVFSDPSSSRESRNDPAFRAQQKAFMSSKVSKLRTDHLDAVIPTKTQAEKEDEKTNAQNDAILHKLIHTKLLSGSLDPNLDLAPAKRRKALEGRILEVAGKAKFGKGENLVRDAERNKASKRVREGISEKRQEKAKQELEEAKNIGNYHPTLKKTFGSSSPSTSSSRTRVRGLKMGVGNYRGGFLQLGPDDIRKAEGMRHEGSSRGGGGVGRGRGRSRKRR